MRKAEQPLYLRDFPQNKFVTELLLAAKLTDGSMFADIGNAQIDAAVAQTRAFFADEYEKLAARAGIKKAVSESKGWVPPREEDSPAEGAA